ncbi:MAG: HAMP domain-containing sensor histidine kinase [Dehalococcoidia bacterium]
MSLRARVAIAAMLATALVTVVAGWSVVTLVVRDERTALDQSLARQSDVIARPGILAASFGERRFVRGGLPGVRFEPGVVTRLETAGGFVISSDEFPDIDFTLPTGYATALDEDGSRWRVLTTDLPAPLPNVEGATIFVAASTQPLDETITSMRRRVATVGTLAVVAAGVGAWLLASVATRPLERLRAEAQGVGETVDLSTRVTGEGPREVRDLGATLNTMLERIQQESDRTYAALEASRAFAAHAAHELRTPLTSMQTNLDVLGRNPDLSPAERAEVLTAITDQQARLLAVLEALRLLARGELAADDVFEEVDLADLAESVARAARERYPQAAIEVEAPPEPVLIQGWSEGLRVMLDNLLRNACTHGADPDGSGTAHVRVLVRPADEGVRLAVEDHGPGIPPEEQSRLLQPFERGANAAGVGSGLGLALVAQQAELHGGELAIEAVDGGGARLVVTLRAGRPA